MSERTTARGKSGTACRDCGTAYDACTEQALGPERSACCLGCSRTDTHDERDEPAAEAVWCEAHNPVGAPLTAATAHARTDECVHPHGSGTRVPAGPRTWEMPAQPAGVGTVHTHDRDTGEPVVWYRAADGASWSLRPGGRPGDGLYTWAELLVCGPVVEGRPAPEYRRGFYRLRGELKLGQQGTVPAGALLYLTEHQSRVAVAVVSTGEVPRTSVTHDELTRAGAERIENP